MRFKELDINEFETFATRSSPVASTVGYGHGSDVAKQGGAKWQQAAADAIAADRKERASRNSNNTNSSDPSNTDGETGEVSQARGTDSGSIRYENQGKIRGLALDSRLEAMLEKTAKEVGVVVHVSSGGQMSMDAYNRARGEKSNSGGSSPTYYLNRRAVRKGSTRHDNGLAADIQISSAGQKQKLDSPIMNSFVEAFFRNPGAGGGSGDTDYMGDYTIHVDIHTQRARSWNATPDFLAAMNRGISAQGSAQA